MKLTRLSGKRGGERCQHEQPIPSSNDAGVGSWKFKSSAAGPQPALRSQPGNARLQPRKGDCEP